MISIRVCTGEGELLAEAKHEREALLRVDREYRDGDRIEIVSDCRHLMVQMDATLLPGEV